jgi:hypothetical protein
VAGSVFIDALVRDKATFASLCHIAAGGVKEYRWNRLCACLRVTAFLLARYGLINAYERLALYIDCLLEDHLTESQNIPEAKETEDDLLSAFVSTCRDRVIVVRDILPKEGYRGRILLNPRGAPDIRVEQSSRRAFLRKESVAAFCRKSGVTMPHFMDSLGHIMVADNVLVSMGLYSLHVDNMTEAIEIDVSEDTLYDRIRFGA